MNKTKTFLFLLLAICLFATSPNNALAYDFEEETIAFVVFDYSGNINKELTDIWEKIIYRQFRFSNYKMQGFYKIQEAFQYGLPTLDKRRPYFKKEQMRQVADLTHADLIFIIWVDTLQDHKEPTVVEKDKGPDRWVYMNMDIVGYRASDDSYLFYPVRYSKSRTAEFSVPLYEAAEQEIATTMERFKKRLDRPGKKLS